MPQVLFMLNIFWIDCQLCMSVTVGLQALMEFEGLEVGAVAVQSALIVQGGSFRYQPVSKITDYVFRCVVQCKSCLSSQSSVEHFWLAC